MNVAAPFTPVTLVRGNDETLVREAVTKTVHDLLGDADRAFALEEFDGDDYELRAVVDACQTPPLFSDRRVVVARGAERFASAEAVEVLVGYLADPLPSTAVVLVWASGRLPKSLADAIKAAGGAQVDAVPAGGARQQRSWLDERLAASELHFDANAAARIAGWLGEDLGRLAGLLETLAGVYGPGARIGVDEVEPYLGEAGSVAPWDLTDALDAGDVQKALDLLHRTLAGRHPLVVLAGLHGHYGRMLSLDGADVTDERSAAALLGMTGKSTFPAKKALLQSRRLGSQRVAKAITLLAQADLDLKGAKSWPDGLVLELLVARLAKLASSAR